MNHCNEHYERCSCYDVKALKQQLTAKDALLLHAREALINHLVNADTSRRDAMEALAAIDKELK